MKRQSGLVTHRERDTGRRQSSMSQGERPAQNYLQLPQKEHGPGTPELIHFCPSELRPQTSVALSYPDSSTLSLWAPGNYKSEDPRKKTTHMWMHLQVVCRPFLGPSSPAVDFRPRIHSLLLLLEVKTPMPKSAWSAGGRDWNRPRPWDSPVNAQASRSAFTSSYQ